MNQVASIIKEAVEHRGKSKADVARKLQISSQLLGQYITGKHKPKADFYLKWKEAFGEDLLKKVEGNVSHETNGVEDAAPAYESKLSLERAIENMTIDKLKSTDIIERLVTILEKHMLERVDPHHGAEVKERENLLHKKTSSKAG